MATAKRKYISLHRKLSFEKPTIVPVNGNNLRQVEILILRVS